MKHLLTFALTAIILILLWTSFLLIVGIIIAFVNFIKYQKYKQLKPTALICPNCGSSIVKFVKTPSSATSITANGNLFDLMFTNIDSTKTAICQDCGQEFYFLTKMEIDNLCSVTKKRIYFGEIMCFIGVGIILYFKFFA